MQIHSGPHNTSSFKKGLWWKIIISIIGLAVVGFLFSKYPSESGGWYHELKQPFFAPAYWMPFVIWPLVYVLMGTSFGIIWHISTTNRYPIIRKFAKRGLILFAVHLLFNLICPIILIGFQLPGLAMADFIVLIVLIILLIRHFFRLDRVAGFLLVPYLIWIIYAASLNAAILVLN